MFNSAQDCQINSDALDDIPSKTTMIWMPFSPKEFKSPINKCNNLSTLGPDHIL